MIPTVVELVEPVVVEHAEPEHRWIYHVKNGRTPIIKAEFQAMDQHKKQDADKISDLFTALRI